MRRKYPILLMLLGLVIVLAFTGFAVWQATASTPKFNSGGSVFRVVEEEAQILSFDQGSSYSTTISGAVSFQSREAGKVTIPKTSFAHFEDNSTMALSDGVLLDFDDLSDNFINNYYIPAGLSVVSDGQGYTAQTTAGTMGFGEHMWKLADNMYLLRSAALKVCFGKNDVHDAGEFVQISVSKDGVYYIQSADGLWTTISPDCYVETAKGVKVYPVSLLVDDGSYKLSLAKLAVSTDDAIVLTELESRRQIVPKLNIDAQDGEDGKDGLQGDDGDEGKAGSDGGDGADGKSGGGGTTGTAGEDGVGGKKGEAGASADSSSATKIALPTMTVSEWLVTPTGLKGQITVTDRSGLFGNMKTVTNAARYPATVTITEEATGRVVACYPVTDYSHNVADGDSSDFSSKVYVAQLDTEKSYTFMFTSDTREELEPDTRYILSVRAYYRTESPDMVYEREFINRVFTTDSIGVSLAYKSATQTTLTLAASLMKTVDLDKDDVKVYLLTPGQNENFVPTATNADYTDVVTLTKANSGQFVFDGSNGTGTGAKTLKSNTKYIARVAVNGVLSKQELEVITLKQLPVYEGDVTVYYNRTTNTFQVWRPTGVDPDKGAVRYFYTAYEHTSNTDSTGKAVKTVEVSTAANAMVDFTLNANTLYTFGVTVEFNDNEKIITYDLGRSEKVSYQGVSMPAVILDMIKEDDDTTPEGESYHSLNAILRIKCNTAVVDGMTQSSSMLLYDSDEQKKYPIRLEIKADQVESRTITLELGPDQVPFGSNWEDPTTTPMPQGFQGYVSLPSTGTHGNQDVESDVAVVLDLQNLYQNTTYTITVYGYLDLGDGYGHVMRQIGSASFRTKNTSRVKASMTEATADGLACTITLALEDPDANGGTSTANQEKINYEIAQIKKGCLSLSLWNGQGNNKTFIKQIYITGTALDKLFTTEGLTVTAAQDFGESTDADSVYTIMIASISDISYTLGLEYVNYFEDIQGGVYVDVSEPSPPPLTETPEQAITATPILRDEVTKYDPNKLSQYSSLPEGAVTGYALQANYDNSSHIADTITYYAFDFATFMNLIEDYPSSKKDPLESGAHLWTATIPFEEGSVTAPKAVVFFDGYPDSQGTQNDEGWYIYQAGAPDESGLNGMSRGNRYIFFYTVNYTSKGERKEYPAEMIKTMPAFQAQYGGFMENNIRLGTSVGYYLSSGVCHVPNIMPDFHTYVASTAQDALPDDSSLVSGKFTLHYSWRDVENLLANSKFYYKLANGSETSAALTAGTPLTAVETGTVTWYETEISYAAHYGSAGENVTIEVDAAAYDHPDKYKSWLSTFGLPADTGRIVMTSIPLDYSYALRYSSTETKPYDGVTVEMAARVNDSALYFILTGKSTGTLPELAKRAAAMEVTLKAANGKTFSSVLPLYYSDSDGYYAPLDYAALPIQDFVNTGLFTLTGAKLLIDGGEQGWDYLQPSGGAKVALQYYGANASGAVQWGKYFKSSESTYTPASAAYWTQSGGVTSASLRDTVFTDSSKDQKVGIGFETPMKSGTYTMYQYPMELGINATSAASMSSTSEDYMIPKKLATVYLTITGGSAQITEVKPTILKPALQTPVEQEGGNTVAGLEVGSTTVNNPTGKDVYAAIFENQNLAYTVNVANAVQVTYGGQSVRSVKLEVTTDTATNVSTSKYFEVKGLVPGKTYYIAFYYEGGGGRTLLTDTETRESSVYAFTCSNVVVITPQTPTYSDQSYFNKSVEVKFGLTRVHELQLTYDIYSTQDDAKYGNLAKVLLTDKQLRDGNILQPPKILSVGTGANTLKLDLVPSKYRDSLKPGVTYYLRISANDGASSVVAFTVGKTATYSAIVYPQNVGSNYMNISVIISDPQFSIMGKNVEDSSYRYLIRFERKTDTGWEWMKTTYDTTLFSDAQMTPFVFDDSVMTAGQKMDPSTEYRLRVFAVPDSDHNGTVSLPVQKANNQNQYGNEDLSYDALYSAPSNAADAAKYATVFQMIVDQAFYDGTKALESEDVPEAQAAAKVLLIGEGTQKTTGKDGYTLNTEEGNIYVERVNPSTIRVVFMESFNLVTGEAGSETHVFNKIQWSIPRGFYTVNNVVFNMEAGGTIIEEDKLIKSGKIQGFNIYYLTIPYEVPNGTRYLLELRLHKANAEANEEPIKISLTFTG